MYTHGKKKMSVGFEFISHDIIQRIHMKIQGQKVS